MSWADHWLEHPLARDRDLDDPSTTALRREIIAGKPFLQAIYRDWYLEIARQMGQQRPILEVGAGAGISRGTFPDILRTDILLVPGLDLVMDGCRAPFVTGSIGGIVLTNVFHHIPDPAGFLGEVDRCLMPGGMLAMVEPWLSPWSLFVYRHFHHEPVDPAAGWANEGRGPLSGANSALPWIVFERDVARFKTQYPRLELLEVRPIMPFRYLVSGGVSRRSLVPGWSTPFWRALERSLQPFSRSLAMFALIVLRKREAL